MMIRLTMTGMAVLIGLILLPAFAVAQTPEERVDAALTRAESAGIPQSLLQSKIDEGKAKGIPMDRIAAAVEARLKGLEQARAAMTRESNDVNAAELSVGADAIGAGVSAAVLAEIAASTGHDRRAVAIAALTQLVAQGIVSEAALTRVQDALARGPQALANLASQSGVAGTHVPEAPGAPSTSGGGTSAAPTSVPTPGQAAPPSPPQRGGRGGF
jgi:hypothetical protein